LNIASVWELPVLFVIENNGPSTPTNEQYRCENLADKKGYGMESHIVDGKIFGSFNLLSELKASMKEIHVRFIRNLKPSECGMKRRVGQNMFRKN
jgi:2-oxoisovalerate dehydrogenase E1 component